MSKIKALFHYVCQLRDRNGNVYYSLRATDTQTGKEIYGYVDDKCPAALANELGLKWDEYRVTEEWVKSREFDRRIKNIPYLGCVSADVIKNIRKAGVFIQGSLSTQLMEVA